MFDGDEAAMETFLAEVTTPEWNLRQDGGRPWAEAIETLAAEHPHHRERIEAFRIRWIETLGYAHAGTVAVLDELRRNGIRLFALTNWSGETFPLARPRYPFLEWFEGIVVSGDVQLVKPDPRIFRLLLDRYGLDAGATVFIDDSVDNVRAAESLGFAGIPYTDSTSLRVELSKLGLLDGEQPA